MRAGEYTLLRTLSTMTLSGNSEIQQVIGEALASRPYSHDQRAVTNVTAVITVERDLRFLPRTLESVLRQSVLPSTIVIADCSGNTVQSVQTGFEIIPTVAEVYQEVPEPQHISVQLVRVTQAKSFADAVSKVLRTAQIDTSTKMLWLLHDDSRPADDRCLEALLDAWRNTPTAALLGAKQLDWEGTHLHAVGAYAALHRVTTLVVDGEPDQEQYDTRRDVFAVSLAGALVPMNTLTAVGGVNPWFGTFDESDDFCRRLCRNGKRVVVVPQARIAHRRARWDGVRSKGGEPIDQDDAANTSMAQLSGEQKYRYTDINALWWPLAWIAGLIVAAASALRLLFRKNPYRAWCTLCMPWIALCGIPGALGARHRLKKASTVPWRALAPLTADRQQIRQWHARISAFNDQCNNVVLDPLATAHLRARLIRRWALAATAAALALICTVIMYWGILRYAFADTSMYSNQLLPTDATFRQLVESATTPWVFGIGTGIPVPPTPWLLVLMVCSVCTGGHVSVAMALIFFLSAPLCVLSFWALAGVVTRSDTVRVLCGLLWYGCALAFGLYAEANLPMLTVMVFLPGALALSFKAVGLYRTEAPVNPRSSIQAAAASALMFIPAVAAEPQLLLALIVIFVAFLVFVRRHRLMLLLIPFPAAFALAPTLVNAVRYWGDGMWRQLFGDIMVPVVTVNGTPEILNLNALIWRTFGIDAPQTWSAWATPHGIRDACIIITMIMIVMVAIIALFRPSVFRACRILWTVAICGFALAIVSAAVVVAVMPYGVAGGSVLPGVALAACGLLASVALMAGSAVKPFNRLTEESASPYSAGRIGRGAIAVLLAVATATCCWYGWSIATRDGIGITGSGLPMVARDYLDQQGDRRILALRASGNGTVEYSVMRTGRGDLIDSSPAYRVSAAYGLQHDTDDEQLARLSAHLLANSDDDAIATLSDLGFGGIHVVTGGSGDISARASEQLLANVTASQGTQSVVSNTDGTYFRLTLNATPSQHIDASAQHLVQHSPWRSAWLWCLGIIVVLYCLVAIPRRRTAAKEEQE